MFVFVVVKTKGHGLIESRLHLLDLGVFPEVVDPTLRLAVFIAVAELEEHHVAGQHQSPQVSAFVLEGDGVGLHITHSYFEVAA